MSLHNGENEHCCCEHEHNHKDFCHVDGCCCHDDESLFHVDECDCCGDDDKENKKLKIIRLAVGGVIFAAGLFLKAELKTTLCIAAYIILGYDVLINALKNIFRGKIFDENFLMSIATIGAIIIKEFSEAAGVILFYQIGEMFQDYAVDKSEASINEIMNIRPDYAYLCENGERIKINASDIKTGQIIVVSPGERIPVDGKVIDGSTYLDTSCLTGESTPQKAEKGDEVLGGSVNLNGVIYLEIIREYKDSASSRIIEVMRSSLEKKARSEKFITSFAKKYTPTVVALAAIIAVFPPFFDNMQFAKWLYRALSFLVVSCPCALVVSVPLAFFAGLGAASRKGVVIKGGHALEAFARADTAVFDKTGTLTEGIFEVSEIRCNGVKAEFLELCAYAEYYSDHPIAGAIKKAYAKKIDQSCISDYKEIPGKGISVNISGKNILVGNAALLKDINVSVPEIDTIGTAVYMAEDGVYIGYLTVSDRIRETNGIEQLKAMGLKTIMLTGDTRPAAEKTARIVGIDEVHSNLLPQDKVSILENIAKSHNCIFTGDGINDAPVLALADAGVAMGKIGSDAAIEAADAVLMTDDLSKLPEAVKVSKKTMSIVNENIVFSLGVKIAVMLLSLFGIGTMWLAVFADVGVALLAILNSIRVLRN